MGFGSISGIAKQAAGSVSDFRKVLDFNPGSLPFPMPPQVQLGLAAAAKANQVLGLGLKVPSATELQQLATGQLQGILKGLQRDVISQLDKAKSEGLAKLGSADTILNKIDWLL